MSRNRNRTYTEKPKFRFSKSQNRNRTHTETKTDTKTDTDTESEIFDHYQDCICLTHNALSLFGQTFWENNRLSGSRLMWSLIMLSFGYCDQIYPDYPISNNSLFFIHRKSVIVIIRLIFSLYLGPKVITLNGFHWSVTLKLSNHHNFCCINYVGCNFFHTLL